MTARHPSENAIQRIRTTVKRVEAMPVETARSRRRPPRRGAEFFPAEITGDEADATSGPTGLSWKRMASDGAGGLEDLTPAVTGTGTAFGINGERPAIGTRVWLRVAGMIDDGSGRQVPMYLFQQQPSQSGFPNYVQFTEDATWTIPSNVTALHIMAVGGGGGGGAGGSNESVSLPGGTATYQRGGGAGGGGGGGFVFLTPVSPGDVLTIVVGTGGNGGTSSSGTGGTGGSTTVNGPWNGLILASGGTGGNRSNASQAGASEGSAGGSFSNILNTALFSPHLYLPFSGSRGGIGCSGTIARRGVGGAGGVSAPIFNSNAYGHGGDGGGAFGVNGDDGKPGIVLVRY